MVENLRKTRKNTGLSQRQLGDRIGVSEQVIGYWERGNRMPSSAKVILLAGILGVTSDYLLGLSDESSIVYPALSPDKHKLLDMFHKFLREGGI